MQKLEEKEKKERNDDLKKINGLKKKLGRICKDLMVVFGEESSLNEDNAKNFSNAVNNELLKELSSEERDMIAKAEKKGHYDHYESAFGFDFRITFLAGGNVKVAMKPQDHKN